MTSITTPTRPATATRLHDVLIVGSGFAGIGMAIRLQQSGIDDFAVLERSDSRGGTWRDNTYPGAACDVASHAYSLSFEPKSDWSGTYGTQPEIRSYLEACAAKHRLHRKIRTGQDVASATFDESSGTWTLETSAGMAFRAPVVIFATGGLKDPALPDLPGLHEFRGAQMHSARWDHDVTFRDKRIGVIGTGASAIQLVPRIVASAGHTTIFQRTAPWVIPKVDRRYLTIERLGFRFVPGVRELTRQREFLAMEATQRLIFASGRKLTGVGQQILRRIIRHTVSDPVKRAAVTPDIELGCKRILKSNDWYRTIDRHDVAVETAPIKRITATGVELRDGRHVALDVLVHCTGFTVSRPLGTMQVFGRNGLELAEHWGERPRAHFGITVPGFPNAFLLGGPNTALGHNSIVQMIEQGIEYALAATQRLREADGSMTIEVTQAAMDAFVDEVDRRNAATVWASGCDSWYLNGDGANFATWPGTVLEYRRRARFDEAAHTLAPVVGARRLRAL